MYHLESGGGYLSLQSWIRTCVPLKVGLVPNRDCSIEGPVFIPEGCFCIYSAGKLSSDVVCTCKFDVVCSIVWRKEISTVCL